MTTPRHGGDRRGSATSRRISRAWLASPGAGFGGDGVKVPCVHCGRILSLLAPAGDPGAMERDRIVPGASYRRTNIQPSCPACNKDRGDNPNWSPS